ncbi:alpha/beta hydrolase [Mucilaginibacter sp. Bleaf8]|uniref:alpha/beta hydrolase family protein n=1 Tax=Mucilaginibacter sp. Bleaf8 TaxID=2834430 RepID=UPI001BD08478|nr:alpha/beta fold hydrolase [Mucilaginibacter sp. Bleaf8]MBS7566234.1 alpha/beta hydrolase [Mucilaginibacter sp. Bleaf8]
MIKTDNFIIPGSKGRPMAADLTYDDAQLYAPLIIFVHGFKGFKDWGTHHLVARYFAENGYRLLKFNFSHNGTTPEQPVDFADLIAFSENTFSIELEDLKLVIDFATSGSVIPAATSVVLLGHSMGGGISIIKAAEDNRVSKLITMASVGTFRNLWPLQAEQQWKTMGVMYFPNYRTGQQMPIKVTLLDDLDRNPGRLNVLARAADVQQPWLLIHGTADSTVPISQAHELKAMQPNAQLLVMPNADHVFGGTHPYLQAELPGMLLELCKKAMKFLEDGNV